MSYSEEDGRDLTRQLARTASLPIDVSNTPPETQSRMLCSLVDMLDTALKIAHETHYADPRLPEPYPGSCATVIKQARSAIALARKSGLIP